MVAICIRPASSGRRPCRSPRRTPTADDGAGSAGRAPMGREGRHRHRGPASGIARGRTDEGRRSTQKIAPISSAMVAEELEVDQPRNRRAASGRIILGRCSLPATRPGRSRCPQVSPLCRRRSHRVEPLCPRHLVAVGEVPPCHPWAKRHREDRIPGLAERAVDRLVGARTRCAAGRWRGRRRRATLEAAFDGRCSRPCRLQTHPP